MGSPDGSLGATGWPSTDARRAIRSRRWRRLARFDTVAAFFAATVAGLSLMVPLDPRMIGGAHELDVTMTVFNAPQSTAAGAMLAVVAAVYAMAAGPLAAWSTSFAGAVVLLIGAVVARTGVGAESRAILSFVDCVVAGAMIGTLAPAFMRRPGPAAGYLTGVLSGIVIGGQIQVPEGGGTPSVLYRMVAGEPSLWLSGLAVVLLGVGVYRHRRQGTVSHTVIADLPLATILAAAVLLTATSLTAEWAARYDPGNVLTVIGATVMTVLAALVATLLVPGRGGALVLLSAAAGAAGSAVIAVPHPYWTGYVMPAVVAAGVLSGYRRPMPMAGLALAMALSVYAAATARFGHHSAAVPVISCFAVGLVAGYCYGSVRPRTATSTVLGIAMLAAPSAVMGLRGHGGVGYSVHWYRDPHAVESPLPGIVAIAIGLGCMAALLLVRRLRPIPLRRNHGRTRRPPPTSRTCSSGGESTTPRPDSLPPTTSGA